MVQDIELKPGRSQFSNPLFLVMAYGGEEGITKSCRQQFLVVGKLNRQEKTQVIRT
jgi:hypothetical protein